MLSDKDELKKVTNKDGFVRAFYEVLKTHTQFVIGQIFITGVTSITLDNLTSGFNISKNITDYPSMNSAVGFTLDEVKGLLDYMQVPEKEKTLELFKENYNVYLESKADTRYADILYSPIGGGIPYIFELKYLSESRYKKDNSLLEKAIADADEQLAKDIQSLGGGKGVAVVFVGKSCKYHEIKI